MASFRETLAFFDSGKVYGAARIRADTRREVCAATYLVELLARFDFAGGALPLVGTKGPRGHRAALPP
eukprot:gene22787-4471_t